MLVLSIRLGSSILLHTYFRSLNSLSLYVLPIIHVLFFFFYTQMFGTIFLFLPWPPNIFPKSFIVVKLSGSLFGYIDGMSVVNIVFPCSFNLSCVLYICNSNLTLFYAFWSLYEHISGVLWNKISTANMYIVFISYLNFATVMLENLWVIYICMFILV